MLSFKGVTHSDLFFSGKYLNYSQFSRTFFGAGRYFVGYDWVEWGGVIFWKAEIKNVLQKVFKKVHTARDATSPNLHNMEPTWKREISFWISKSHLFQQENASNQIGQIFQKIPNPPIFFRACRFGLEFQAAAKAWFFLTICGWNMSQNDATLPKFNGKHPWKRWFVKTCGLSGLGEPR